MAPSFTSGDGPNPLLRHINWPYFVPEAAFNKDAFCGPPTTVQSVSSSACCPEAGGHHGGLISHF